MELRMPTWEQVETVYHNDLIPSFLRWTSFGVICWMCW